MPGDNSTQNQNSPNPVPPVSGGIPVPADHDVPPMPFGQTDSASSFPASQGAVPPPDPNQTSPAGEDGSAAPGEFPPMTTSAPKKKFGGGKIIATILGIFLLVGGIAGGVVLTGQQQLFQQKADDTGCKNHDSKSECNSSCSPVKNGKRYECKWVDDSCKESANECGGTSDGAPPSTTQIVDCSLVGQRNSAAVQCGKTPDGSCGGFCIIPVDKSCNDMLKEQCNYIPTTGATCSYIQDGVFQKKCSCTVNGVTEDYFFDRDGICNPSDNLGLCRVVQNSGGICGASLTNDFNPGDGTNLCWTWTDSGVTIKNSGNCREKCDAHKHTCNTNVKTSTGCNTQNPKVGDSQSFDGLCGQTQQIDISCGTGAYLEHRSKVYPDCPGDGGPGNTARCVSLKAYTTNWRPLEAATLGSLKAGDKINLCVNGSATSGPFDKARFTINGALQAETTGTRPNSTDFCQIDYVIPAGATTFNIKAEIHHKDLGWK